MIVKVMYLRQYCELRVEISAVPCPARDPSEGTIFGSNEMIAKLLHMTAFYPTLRPILLNIRVVFRDAVLSNRYELEAETWWLQAPH